MNNFRTRVLKEKDLIDSKMTTVEMTKNNNDDITPAEIRIISKQLLQKAPKGTRLSIRALGIDKWNCSDWKTLQKFDKDIQVQDDEEYYDGKVRNTAKFLKFSQIQLTVIKPK